MEIQRNHSTTIERYVSPLPQLEEIAPTTIQLRPASFDDYPGQTHAKENLKIFVAAAKNRGQPLDHVILHGPPGLGKTTLAHIIANELSVPFHSTTGPSLDKPGDLAGLLAGLEPSALLFIDEIHRLPIQVEEVLYSAMENFSLDVVVGQGPTARSVTIPLAPFTLVGATTRLSSLSRPFLSRFGIQEKLDFYEVEALEQILVRGAGLLGIQLGAGGARELALSSRGTPRVALRLLRRVWDFAEVLHAGIIDDRVVREGLQRLDIDSQGLDRMDRDILIMMHTRYQGGPVGIDALAITLGEERSTIEEVYEPFLVYCGYVSRSARGRMLTEKGIAYLQTSQNGEPLYMKI